ncbi:MAG TPA: hypothetical protein VMU45_11695 [Candidatus Eisenbacteria bacterium]|nr:hypothetical protein [Candidatus Eisenbacteria bacterium]
MTYAKKILLLLMLSVAAALGAAAQDAHVKFTLPHDATWGKTALPAATYSVSLEFGGITKAYVTSEDGAKLAFVAVPQTTEITDSCDKTSVTLQRNGPGWSIRSLCFGELQMALYFPLRPATTSLAALPRSAEPATGPR